ncbi:MAG TPA: hypothetical protein VET85_07440 [Stellaceae bacterium]|nr:hypothetical protein [Stellaceae bacterium]
MIFGTQERAAALTRFGHGPSARNEHLLFTASRPESAMRVDMVVRYWLVAFVVCAAVGGAVLRPDRALDTYFTLRAIAPSSRPVLSNREQGIDAETALRSAEPDAETPDPSQIQTLRKGIALRRAVAARRLATFLAVILLVPALVSLIPLAGLVRRRRSAALGS